MYLSARPVENLDVHDHERLLIEEDENGVIALLFLIDIRYPQLELDLLRTVALKFIVFYMEAIWVGGEGLDDVLAFRDVKGDFLYNERVGWGLGGEEVKTFLVTLLMVVSTAVFFSISYCISFNYSIISR